MRLPITSMDIVKHYGSDLTKESLKTRYFRIIKPDVELLAEAVRSGVDAKNVVLSCDGKFLKLLQYCTFSFREPALIHPNSAMLA
jgi:hypothetical protein